MLPPVALILAQAATAADPATLNQAMVFINPHFPALRVSPMAFSGATRKSKFLAVKFLAVKGSATLRCGIGPPLRLPNFHFPRFNPCNRNKASSSLPIPSQNSLDLLPISRSPGTTSECNEMPALTRLLPRVSSASYREAEVSPVRSRTPFWNGSFSRPKIFRSLFSSFSKSPKTSLFLTSQRSYPAWKGAALRKFLSAFSGAAAENYFPDS
jgi:hypothetical protein